MKPSKKILIGILTFLLLSVFMVSPIYAAVITNTLDVDQKQIILNNSTSTGTKYNFNSQSTYWKNAIYTDSYSGAQYVMRGNTSSYSKIVNSNTPVFNLSMFLSGFDSMTIEFVVMQDYTSSSAYMPRIGTVQSVVGSVATSVSYQNIGSARLDSVYKPGSTGTASTAKTTYYGTIYQVTVTNAIDYLRINFTDYYYSDIENMLLGFCAVYINGTSEALQNIEYQVSQIGTKVDDLKTAIQNAASNIGGIATNQGNILTSVNQIKGLSQTLVDNQQIIMYATQDDQLIITALNDRFDDVKDALDEYKQIMEQYHNPPEISNVTNIINQGVPQEYNPQVVAPVLGVIFDNSIVTTILIAVLALATMSYVLFGKKR